MITIAHVSTLSIRADDTAKGRVLGYSAPIIFLGVRAKQKGPMVSWPLVTTYYQSGKNNSMNADATITTTMIVSITNLQVSL